MTDFVLMWNVVKNNVKFCTGRYFFLVFLIHPYGEGFVMQLPYWLFSSIFNFFVTILLFSFVPFTFNLYINLRFTLSFGNKIWESKVSLVFTQLTPPIGVFPNSNTAFTFITVYAIAKRYHWIAFARVEFKLFV